MLNIIALMGRLVADPELRKTPNGVSTTTFTIACERSYAPQGKDRVTDFIEIVAWRGTAEFVCRYFRKGQLIAINGSLQTRIYENREGLKRKVYEILADNCHFAESKKGSVQGTSTVPQNGRGDDAEPSYYSGGPEDFAIIDDSEDLPF